MPKKVTILILGDGSVGKSCMLMRYLKDEYVDTYDPTIQDTFRKTVSIGGESVDVEFIDTSGQEEYYSSSTEATIKSGDGFLFVYSILIPDSLEKLELVVQNVFLKREMTAANPTAGIVVCGNKCDRDADRKISKETGAQFAAKYKADFFESKRDIHYPFLFPYTPHFFPFLFSFRQNVCEHQSSF